MSESINTHLPTVHDSEQPEVRWNRKQRITAVLTAGSLAAGLVSAAFFAETRLDGNEDGVTQISSYDRDTNSVPDEVNSLPSSQIASSTETFQNEREQEFLDSAQTVSPDTLLKPIEQTEKERIAPSPPTRFIYESQRTGGIIIDASVVPTDGYQIDNMVDKNGDPVWNFSAIKGDMINAAYFTRWALPSDDPKYFQEQVANNQALNVALGAHTWSGGDAIFDPLTPENVQIGDSMRVQTENGELEYIVTDTVDPTKGTLLEVDTINKQECGKILVIVCVQRLVGRSTQNLVVAGKIKNAEEVCQDVGYS